MKLVKLTLTITLFAGLSACSEKQNSEPNSNSSLAEGLLNELSFTDSVELDIETAKEVTYASSIETKSIETDSVVLELATSKNKKYSIITSCEFLDNSGIRTETIYMNNDPISMRIERYTGESCWINSEVTYSENNYYRNGEIVETKITAGLNSNRPIESDALKMKFAENNLQKFLSDSQ